MPRRTQHACILNFPYARSLQGAILEALREEVHGKRLDLVTDYQELRPSIPPDLLLSDGRPCERVQGQYVPRRLRFKGVHLLERTGVYARLEGVPRDHAARSIRDLLHFRPANKEDPLYLLLSGSDDPDGLMFSARGCLLEPRSGPVEEVHLVRHWSPPPLLKPGMVPNPSRLRQRYGGDPITIHLGRRTYHQRLFVGGVDLQGEQRPWVDAVLNLGEEPSCWVKDGLADARDRWALKGEGLSGMSTDELTGEAHWVIERLRAGERVLVHCAGGFNRSVTTCCAVLILLEGLSAEASLGRVREHHPWARPDTYHWLVLRWLARTV